MPGCPVEKLSISSLSTSSWLPEAQLPWGRLQHGKSDTAAVLLGLLKSIISSWLMNGCSIFMQALICMGG